MTRDLWLVCLQDFHEEADANFPVSHQVNQAQAGVIRERLEEEFNPVLLVSHTVEWPAKRSSIYYDFDECRVPWFIENHTIFESKITNISIRFLRSKSAGIGRFNQSLPTSLLRLSRSMVSRQTAFILPMRSRLPSSRKPHDLCSAILATFSGKMLACNVQ